MLHMITKQQYAVSIAEVICFNAVKRQRKKDTSKTRHIQANETFFPLYVGLMLHSKTHRKGMVTSFAKHGMSVSYSRVQCIESNVANQPCKLYKEKGVVCPPTIEKNIFTTTHLQQQLLILSMEQVSPSSSTPKRNWSRNGCR